ncbi:hypothetical protein EI94DRAFT_1813704 [Lactarius quietus]|nr:hypothetical protein EI94DRAFT_1813704 [Lactarius quietus]
MELPRELPRAWFRWSSTKQEQESPQVGPSRPSRYERSRARSTPQNVQALKDNEDLPPLPPSTRSRAKSSGAASRRNPSSDRRQTGAEHSRASRRRPILSYPSRRPLHSTVRQALPEHFKFRMLVVGKRHSGKTSLIKTAFKVDVACNGYKAAPERADIDAEFCPEDNRYLIVHECSGLDSQSRDSQDLQTIQDFISRRTGASCSPSERLHAVWICVPASDAIAGRLGDGVEEILGLKNVPVVLVFTKFDVVISRVLSDIASGNVLHHARARARAHTIFEDSCRRLFRKEPSEIPAEIVSENPRFIDLVDNLTATTDRFITGSRASSARSSSGSKQRVGAMPLSWSAAVRVNHDIKIQSSIEVGRSRYWRSLWSSLDFADQSLKNCVNVVHDDIVEIWNLNDMSRYLSSAQFKAKMSHVVKDLAASAKATSGAGGDFADWVNDVYRGSQENVRCVMGYIVDLTVILDGIFRSVADDMSPKYAQQVLERHVRSGHRDAIHRDIEGFIKEAFAIRFAVPHKDLILERIVDLLEQYCVPFSEIEVEVE